MVLPFVRELFADVEKLPAFTRAASHLKTGAGRMSVSGLTPTAKALLIALLHRGGRQPLIVVVRDNRAAEELLPVVAAFGELTGAIAPHSERGASSIRFSSCPRLTCCPSRTSRPIPEIQEQRATALWKMAAGAAAVVIVPVAAAAMRLRAAEFYAELARIIRRGETLDIEPLVQHLNTVGYPPSDVVEMPGEYALRGGILDVYPPEADRPLRIELFGDEVESIRKFDPATQRSSGIRRRSGAAAADRDSGRGGNAGGHPRAAVRQARQRRRGSGARRRCAPAESVFPGWEFYAPAWRAPLKRCSTCCPTLPCWWTSPTTCDANWSLVGARRATCTSAAASATWCVPRSCTCRRRNLKPS